MSLSTDSDAIFIMEIRKAREMKSLDLGVFRKGQETNEHDDELNVCDLFNGLNVEGSR